MHQQDEHLVDIAEPDGLVDPGIVRVHLNDVLELFDLAVEVETGGLLR